LKRIDAMTRQKVIELHKEGKEIKEIAQILNDSNIKISYGSTWNIVEASRSQSKASEPSNQVDQSPSSVLNSTIPDDLMREHSSISSSAVDSKPSGCPLSRFMPEIKDSDLEDSNDSALEKKAINYDLPAIKNKITNDPYMEEIDIHDADSEPDIYTDPNADYDERYDGIKGQHRFNYQYTNTMNPYLSNPFSTTNQQISGLGEPTSKNVIKKTETPEDSSIGMDWDENWAGRFWKRVMDDKRELAEERRKLEKYGAYLAQEKNNLEEGKMALETREAKISEVRDLIPSAQQLKEMGAQFSQVQAFLNCVREKAAAAMIDERTAAWELVKDLETLQCYRWTTKSGCQKDSSTFTLKYNVRTAETSNCYLSSPAKN
jgi:hypothetical protein